MIGAVLDVAEFMLGAVLIFSFSACALMIGGAYVYYLRKYFRPSDAELEIQRLEAKKLALEVRLLEQEIKGGRVVL